MNTNHSKQPLHKESKPAASLSSVSKRRLFLTSCASLMMATPQAFAERAHEPLAETSSPRPSLHFSPEGKDAPSPDRGITGDWRGIRPRLEDRGIAPYAVFATEFLSNVDGGLRPGTATAGLLEFGVEVDLEPSLGWKGGGLTVSAFAAYGEDGSAENIGDFNVASNLFTATDFNVFNLFLSQSIGDDFLYLKAGQIAADDDFMGSETAGLFLNSAFGPLPTESGNIGAPIFPLAAPGVFARIRPSDSLSLQAGIYAGDAGPVESGNHGFDWRTGGATGWASFIEARFHHHSGSVKVGAYHHSGEFTDFDTAATEEGLSAVYALIDHRFLEASDRKPGLSAFLRGSIVSQEERATVKHYFDGGIALDHLFHEDDSLGFALSHTVFGDDYLAATPGVSSSETILELTYQLAINHNWMIQPDIQWILDSHAARNDALVVGVRTEISF